MLTRNRKRSQQMSTRACIEALEERQLLSAMPMGFYHSARPLTLRGATIQFQNLPTDVQTGLDNLATMDGLTAPTTTQLVFMGNSHGVETYSIGLSGSAASFTWLTVGTDGSAIVAPTISTETVADVTDTAVTDELNTIATALSFNMPASTDNVVVKTAADLTATYTFHFSNSSSWHGLTVTLDAAGNPIGNVNLPLSVFSTAIQNGLIGNAPAGADPLTGTSTVNVRTPNGKTTYTATYTGATLTSPVKVTVDNTGTLALVPTTSTVQFSTIPSAAQTELQTLATAAGFTGTIDPTTNVRAYDEANGTMIFTIRVPVSKTFPMGTFTFNVQLSTDQNGNPTVPPSNGFGDGGFFGGGFGFGFGFGPGFGFGLGFNHDGGGDGGGQGGDCNGGNSGGNGSSGSSGSTGSSVQSAIAALVQAFTAQKHH